MLRRFLAPWRSVKLARPAGPLTAILRHPSPRHTVGLFFRSPDTLSSDEQAYLHHLTTECSTAATLQHLVTAFHALVTMHDQEGLTAWLTRAVESGIPELIAFVRGVQRDRDAVDGALATNWSQGQVEGQVNRLKLLKRSMFGRARLGLLRQRVLHRG